MRIIAASDYHGILPHPTEIPAGDVLCLVGNIEPTFRPFSKQEPNESQLQAIWLAGQFDDWCAELPVKTVLITGGNHTFMEGCEHLIPKLRNAKYLIDESITIDGVTFWGSPWSLSFYNWPYNADETRLERIYSRIPSHTRVILSHGPAFGYHDYVPGNRHVGSKSLLDRIWQFKHKITLVTGHCHHSRNYGIICDGNVEFVGCPVLDEDYNLVRKPLLVNVKGDSDCQ
jgi:Icc-related predicted phosphoesterase